MYIMDKIDHVSEGLGLLHPHEGKPKIEALLTTYLESIQYSEDDLYTLLTNSGVYDAEGVFLDAIGELFGVARNNMSDTHYRSNILNSIATQDSDGSTERTLEILRLISNTDTATFFEHDISHVDMYLHDTYDNYTFRYLKRIPCAGVSLTATLDYKKDSMMFDELIAEGSDLLVNDSGVIKNLAVSNDGVTSGHLTTSYQSTDSHYEPRAIFPEMSEGFINPFGEDLHNQNVITTTGGVTVSEAKPDWWDDVVLALKFDGTNNGTTITDYSNLANVAETVQGVHTSTTEVALGDTSLKSNGGTGGGAAMLNYAPSSNFEARANYTIAFWIYIPTTGGTYEKLLNRGDNSSYWSVERVSGHAQLGCINFGSYGTSVVSVPYDSWHFITLCEDGVNLYLSLDGVVATQAVGSAIGSGDRPFSLVNFYYNTALNSLTGYIDDLIFVNGTCLTDFTSDFPIPTSSLIPSDSNMATDNGSNVKWVDYTF